MRRILSLCDYSGEWARPYLEAGYDVTLVDPKHVHNIAGKPNKYAMTVQEFLATATKGQFHGILAAPPCTDFAVSGARWFAEKDASGDTELSLEIVDACLDIIDRIDPAWWALENPVSRLTRLRPLRLGRPRLIFDPCDYGDPYTKKTCLWGWFNADLPLRPVEPIEGSKMWSRYGGKSDRTKELRSITPAGFARAFFEANP